MLRCKKIIMVLMVVLGLIISGCGGGGDIGSPGSSGISGGKIVIKDDLHVVKGTSGNDVIAGTKSWFIDINKSICVLDEINYVNHVYETTYGANYLKLDLLLVPHAPNSNLNYNYTITHYTVSFVPVDVYAAPIKSETYSTHKVLLPSVYKSGGGKSVEIVKYGPYIPPDPSNYTLVEVKNTHEFLIFPLNKKVELYEMIFTSNIYPTKYLPYKYYMTITFYGQNDVGEPFSFVYANYIELNDFVNCSYQ